MRTVIRAEMVANVWRVVASVDERVHADEPIVILESMKMEIPVAAEEDCMVKQIFVTEGVVVQEGDPIAEVET